MSTITLTTAGVTKPSTTSLGYNSGAVAQPPSGGADLTAEITTAQYTAASALDGSYVPCYSNAFAGIELKLQIPSVSRGNTWTGLAYGMSAFCQYEGGNGWIFYVRNNSAGAWESVAASTTTIPNVNGSPI